MIYFLDDFKETLIRPSEGWNVEVPRSRWWGYFLSRDVALEMVTNFQRVVPDNGLLRFSTQN